MYSCVQASYGYTTLDNTTQHYTTLATGTGTAEMIGPVVPAAAGVASTASKSEEEEHPL